MSDEQQPKARWTRRTALLVLLLAITGGGFFAINAWQRRGIVPNHSPIVVAMDTTAAPGVYDKDNLAIGASNTEEIQPCLRDLLSRSLHKVPLSAGWDQEDLVISLSPDLVIIHRSAFHHSYNAVFKFGSTNEFAHPADDPRWRFLYEFIGDDKLISLMGTIGNEVPQTKFLVYSRGTDTNWLKPDFRAEWVIKKVEARFPKLKGRITTMVIPNGYNGSFRQPETRELLRSNVIKILQLPAKRKPEKSN